MGARIATAVGALLLVLSEAALACPICAAGSALTPADQLVNAERVLLVGRPRGDWRTVAVIKGDSDAAPADLPPAPLRADRPALVARDARGGSWSILGAVGSSHVPWLRAVSGAKPTADLTEQDWAERVRFHAPYLEHEEPLIADIAHAEVARAPYAAMRKLRPALDAAQVRAWLNDPARSSRVSLYTMLLGIAGGSADLQHIESGIAASLRNRSAENVAALLCADMELRGSAALAVIESAYLADTDRSLAEVEAALLALSVQGNANGAVPQAEIVAAYRRLIARRHPLAGFLAIDLTKWQAWEATADYVALLKSGAPLHPASRFAVVNFLLRSPDPDAWSALRR